MRTAATLVALALVAGGCGGDDDGSLEGLVEDPLASLELSGAEETFRVEEPTHESLGQTVHAEVSVRYRVLEPGGADQVMAEAVVAAEDAGWTVDDDQTGPTLSLRKDLEAGPARASLALLEAAGGDDLVLVIRYDPPL